MMVPISGIWSVALALVGLVLTLLNIADKVSQIKAKAKEPNEKQDERIAALEKTVEDQKRENVELKRFIDDKFILYDGHFKRDKERLDEFERSGKQANTIIIRALQSIIDHDINGNDIEPLKKSKAELDDFLLNR